MPESRFVTPYRPFHLSAHGKELLHDTAEGLIDEVQDEFENYLQKRGSRVDTARWEFLRERENVKVYVDKQPGDGTGNRDMQLLLTVGSISGTVNDALYGELNHTTDEIRKKTFYIGDTLLNGAVLATILDPTVERPFQSLSVRWVVKSIPFMLRAIAKHNDAVLLEATGARQLSNGEQIGYLLMHSITFPDAPPLPQYERLNISLRTLYRQQSPGIVECFSMILLQSFAGALATVNKIIDCGQSKKLTRVLQKKTRTWPGLQNDRGARHDGCSVCGSQWTRHGAKSTCVLCKQVTCARCRHKRVLCSVAPDRRMVQCKVRLCTTCLTSTRQLDGLAFAREEAESRVLGKEANWSMRELSPSDSDRGFSISSSSS